MSQRFSIVQDSSAAAQCAGAFEENAKDECPKSQELAGDVVLRYSKWFVHGMMMEQTLELLEQADVNLKDMDMDRDPRYASKEQEWPAVFEIVCSPF